MDLHEPLYYTFYSWPNRNHIQQGTTYTCMKLLYNNLNKSLYEPCPTRTNMDLHEPLIQYLKQELI